MSSSGPTIAQTESKFGPLVVSLALTLVSSRKLGPACCGDRCHNIPLVLSCAARTSVDR